jgi:nicotinamidase-related amidase
MGRPLVIDPVRTAVVIVDVQRYFIETAPFSAMQAILQPLAQFLPTARRAGMPVVHVRTEFDPDMTDAGRPGSRTRVMMDSLGTALVRGNRLGRHRAAAESRRIRHQRNQDQVQRLLA